MSFSVAARSKAWVYGRSLVETAGSNPAEGVVICVCCECSVLSGTDRSVRQAGHSHRGVLPSPTLVGIAGSNPAEGVAICVCCECSVLSGRGLCVGLVTRTEESYRVWCV